MKETIRFGVTALAALFFGLTATAAKVTTWRGGPGNFSDDNWDNGEPGADDIVVLSDPGAGGAITNDIEGLTVAAVKAEAGEYALTLRGKGITLTSWTATCRPKRAPTRSTRLCALRPVTVRTLRRQGRTSTSMERSRRLERTG